MAEDEAAKRARGAFPAWLPFAGIGLLALVVAYLTATLPLVLGLPLDVFRLVIYHGASTWTNLATFTVTGVLGLAYVVSRRDAVFGWESGFRYVSLPLWVLNTGLGLLSSRLAWGGIDLSEPRLRATFWILLGAGIVAAVDFVLEHKLWTAFADTALAVALWTLILSAPNVIHPDNPVLNPETGGDVKARFFGIVACLLVVWVIVAYLIQRALRWRVSREPQ